MSDNRSLAPALAVVLSSSPWTPRALQQRAVQLLGRQSRAQAKQLIEELFGLVATPYAPPRHQLERLILNCPALEDIDHETVERVLGLSVTLAPPRFAPIRSLENLDVPKITTQGDLARWLDIPRLHLDWFTDDRRTLARAETERLHHYSCRWVPKRNGGWRLLEAPKSRLKQFQHRILRNILDHLPMHEAAHAFVKGRTCAQAAAKHAGERVVVTVDLKDFFLSVTATRVHAIFRCLGYPAPVARLLTSVCTTATPEVVLAQKGADLGTNWTTRAVYRTPHLPQGAPTSPALANFAARGLDRRLAGLARRFEARYTRYADDLTFSGDSVFAQQAGRFLRAVAEIVKDEGFALNPVKTRVMPSHARQSVTGLVVNQHLNLARPTYDALKATLTNCVRRGPAGENRAGHADLRAHLDGRIAWVESINLHRGRKLRRLFDRIAW